MCWVSMACCFHVGYFSLFCILDQNQLHYKTETTFITFLQRPKSITTALTSRIKYGLNSGLDRAIEPLRSADGLFYSTLEQRSRGKADKVLQTGYPIMHWTGSITFKWITMKVRARCRMQGMLGD